jgi:DNA-binding NtrC family response regulator
MSTSKKPVIFLIVPAVEMQSLLSSVLMREGYDVVIAHSKHQAQRMMDQSEPADLIISDYRGPKSHGDDFVHFVRTHGHWNSVPIVKLTHQKNGVPAPASSSGNSLGVFHHARPLEPERLISQVRECLAQ